MRRFLAEDLEAPLSVYGWDAFEYWLQVEAIVSGSDPFSSVEADPQREKRVRDAHQTALTLLRALQKAVRLAVTGGADQGDFWEQIRDRHLPDFLHLAEIGLVEVRQRWAFAEPAPGPVGKLTMLGDPRSEKTRLAPDRDEAVLQHWLSLLPHLSSVQAYFSQIEEEGERPPRERTGEAKRLPPPYSRIFGMVCAEALFWLGELAELRCKVCGDPIKDAERSSRETCGPAHARALSRRRKKQREQT